MRVISQGGEFDVPYDLFVFGITIDNCVTAIRDSVVRPYECTNGFMAKYSTRKKALKAMKMLREAWIKETVEFEDGIYHRNIIFQFPRDSEV